MLTVTPNYYKDFKCIADKCKNSCCIGWEIEIDDSTLEKYNSLDGNFAKQLKACISTQDTAHFKLDSNEHCPFLNCNGLCNIITNLGEDMLCQICRDHPRFRNFYSGYIEIGLGLCCEAAAKLILSKTDKVTFTKPPEHEQSDIINLRQMLFDTIQDRSFTIDERVDNLLVSIDASFPENIDLYAVFSKLERLDDKWSDYLLSIKNGIQTNIYDNSLDTAYEQLIIYLLFRHFSDCQYDGMFKERVLFAVLIYKILRTMNKSNTLEELIELSRLYSCEIEYSDKNIYEILKILS